MPACSPSSRQAPFHWLVISLRGPGIQLARPTDSHVRIGDHFLPMRDPAGGTRNSEQDREHGAGNSEGAVDDPRVEIHVRIQLAGYEIFVLERDFLEFQR